MPPFVYEPTFQLAHDTTTYRLLTREGIFTVDAAGKTFLQIPPTALSTLARQAFIDISFFLRPAHLKQLATELQDPAASDNDRFVLYTHLQNAVVAAHGKLPSCQDTGTASVVAKKGQFVLTDADDAAALSEGIFDCYQERNLRYSQIAPIEMFKERNTGTNLPAQIDCYADFSREHALEYHFLFVAKGGGSANKMYLYQQTPAVLNDVDFEAFVRAKLKEIGTSACPPYHLAVVVGGTSAEACMKTLKLATAHALDDLPTTGAPGGRAFRDTAWE